MQDVLKKLRFKSAGIAINPPENLEKKLESEGFQCLANVPKGSSGVIAFFKDKATLQHFLQKDLKNIEPDSLLWFAYPKGTSTLRSDINRDSICEIGEQYDITTVTAVSINETWSALRFRPIEKVGT